MPCVYEQALHPAMPSSQRSGRKDKMAFHHVGYRKAEVMGRGTSNAGESLSTGSSYESYRVGHRDRNHSERKPLMQVMI